MAETAANDAAQRYAVIEQAYSREDWATVLQDGEELLRQLRQAGNPQFLGLRMRLQLLLGHTQLYGFADKAAAARFYQAVANDSGEAALAKIAEQGLQQCAAIEPPAEQPPPEPVSGTTASAVPDAAPAGSPVSDPAPATLTGPAAPWLTAAAATAAAATPAAGTTPVAETATSAEAAAPWSTGSLIPEVVEEPELIELHQADPALAEEVELTWKEPAPAPAAAKDTLSPDDEELLSGLMLVRIG